MSDLLNTGVSALLGYRKALDIDQSARVWNLAEILAAMRVDKKKNAASIRFALPADIGKVELVDIMNLEVVLE